jgi:serine/threonine-protein kinase
VLDGRADQYALACTAFHLLTGAPPFANSNPAVLIGNHLSSPPPRIGGLRTDLGEIDDVLAKAMAKEPFQRFDTCREFASALTHGDRSVSAASAATQLATNIPRTPFHEATYREQAARSGSQSAWTSRRTALIAIGIAALVAVGIVAFIGARLGQPSAPPPTAARPQPTPYWEEPEMSKPPRETARPPGTVTRTATVTQPAPPPIPAPPPPRTPQAPSGDLGLTTRMSRPACNGQGIVIVGSVTTPGQYPEGVQRLLDAHPGASYLRTDQSCPSLRQADDEGDPIYAVYRPVGTTQSQVCAGVHAAGSGTYGKWMDYTTDPAHIISC